MDNVAEALALLPEDMRRPTRQALLSAYVRPLDAVADALEGLRYWRDLDTATGVRLDVLGRILKVPRQGRADTEYRRALRAEILVLRSDGLPETVLRIVRTYLGIEPGHLTLTPTPPAAFTLWYDEAYALERSLVRLLTRGRAGGVNLQFLSSPEASIVLASVTYGGGALGLSSTYDTSAGGAPAHVRQT